MKNFLSTILSVAGAVFMLAGLAGVVNLAFGTKFGIGTFSGSSTEAIPGDPVIIGFLILMSAICFGIQFLRGRRVVNQENRQV